MEISHVAKTFSKQLEIIDNSLDRLNDLTIKIAKIPAPPFREEERGIFIADKFRGMGYPVLVDEVGNIIASMALNNDESQRKCVVVCAHLDTVFPMETKLDIRKENDKLIGPGVGDDARGLANLLLIADLLKSVEGKMPIYFIANVGEEGIGDLRGVKHLFFGYEHRNRFSHVKYFITIDSAGAGTIIWKSIGSKRYKLTFKGPGGHSFQNFGRVNPIYALSRFIISLQSIELPKEIQTTFSIGKIEGGISVNAIPEFASCLIDLRSEDPKVLENIEGKVKELIETALSFENTHGKGILTANLVKIGDRPAGKCLDGVLLDSAKVATRYLGIEPCLKASSTDANVPQSLGIEAIAVSGSADAANAHSLDEWIDCSEGSLVPLKRNFLLIGSLIL